jgi:hypothetical protein
LLLRAFAGQKWPFHKNLQSSYMDNQIRNGGRTWKIICWNIRGINSSSKWNAIRSKIHESSCDIIIKLLDMFKEISQAEAAILF